MSYLADYRPASFRGVRFHVRASEFTGGRRTVVHQFPGRDDAEYDDLGRRAREFTVRAFVVGNTYFDVRDDLINAFERPGAGMLVHPYFGDRNVVVTSAPSFSESTDEAGMARFSFTCTEVGEQRAFRGTVDTPGRVRAASDAVTAAAAERYETRGTADDVTESVRVSMASNLQDAASKLRTIRGNIDTYTSEPRKVAAGIDRLSDNAASLILTPGQVATDLLAVMGELYESAAQIDNAFGQAVDQVLTSARLFAEYLSLSTRTDSRSVRSTEAALLVRAQSAALASRAAVTLEYESAQLALSTLSTLNDATDAVTEGADGDLYETVVDLRVALSEHFRAEAARLPYVTTYHSPAELPALVVSQMVYGTGERDEEIHRRNDVFHPGLVPSGDLEVLANG